MVVGTNDQTYNIEFFAYRLSYEDGTQIPTEIFSSLVQSDVIDAWDETMPQPGSVIKNIINKSMKNKNGIFFLTGVLVEATNIDSGIEIMDITGKIESAEIKLGNTDEDVEVKEGAGAGKLIFKFKRWRVGILPDKGLLVIERKSTGYDKKLSEYLSSWVYKWASKVPGRTYKSVKVEPFLRGGSISDFLKSGSIGALEFALTADVISSSGGIFDNDLKKLIEKDKNLVVSVEVKAKRGQSFHPDMTTAFVDFIKNYEASIEKCSGKTVTSKRKSKSINLINSLKHKVCEVKEDNDLNVLLCAEEYMMELSDDEN